MYKIAIDGPSGAGKSTLAKMLASHLGFIYVDTGALYRSIGLYMYENSKNPNDSSEVIPALPDIKLELKYSDGAQQVWLNGRNVNSEIRQPQISMYASAVSAIPEVRAFLLDTQRGIASANNVIMDGRDIGTVIMPNAEVKIFLTSSPEKRAVRRYAELCEKGVKTTLEEVLADMKTRDDNDTNRKTAPAIPAEDAIFLDNSGIGLQGTFDKAMEIIKSKINITSVVG